MEVPENHWKYGLGIPLDTDERIALQLKLEQNVELAKTIKVENVDIV